MIIANPLYDVVFKYLLEDMDIVREFLSVILSEEIVTVDVKPQEILVESIPQNVNIYRFDFKAVVRTSTGEYKNILVELQKAKQALDVIRFRKYLGENYQRKEDLIDVDGEPRHIPLPIVTIYILGFRLENILQPVVKINREYRDAITGETLAVKEDFAELLTHDCYFIQVLRLRRQTRTKLESVLQVFSQEYRMEDQRRLDFQGNADDPLVQKMVSRLERANASEKMRKIMDIEDELAQKFEENAREAEKNLAGERKKTDAETARADAETARADAETARADAETTRADAEIEEKLKERRQKEVETVRANKEAEEKLKERERANRETEEKVKERERANKEAEEKLKERQRADESAEIISRLMQDKEDDRKKIEVLMRFMEESKRESKD